MSYTNINKSTDYFNTKLYTGNGSAGHSITGVGHQPDLVWMKGRNQAFDHCWYDAVRGTTKLIRSNLSNAEVTQSGVTAFGSDGFTLGSSGETNSNNDTYASWNWKANGAGSSNTNGSITSTVSANTTSGFSIVTYTGTGSNATVGHGLGVAPSMIIIKRLNATNGWTVYHKSLTAGGFMYLNDTGPYTPYPTMFQNTDPTTAVFSVGTLNEVNASGGTYVAYCFADVQGFSKMGSYVGNGNATTPPFIYTGFKPAFVITKISSGSSNGWTVSDIKRDNAVGGNGNGIGARVLANASSTEETNNIWASIQKYSNGFSPQGTDAVTNANGSTYIYAAFAAAPLVGTNDIPANAR